MFLILPQNIQISGQYLKFGETYASTNTCACSRLRNFLIRKRVLILLFALWQIFYICRLKLIFLSRVIPSSSTASDALMVFPWREMFLSIFLYFERNVSWNFDGLATISLSLSHCITVFVSSSSLLINTAKQWVKWF